MFLKKPRCFQAFLHPSTKENLLTSSYCKEYNVCVSGNFENYKLQHNMNSEFLKGDTGRAGQPRGRERLEELPLRVSVYQQEVQGNEHDEVLEAS
jgi:hypothetical protein